MSSKISLDEWTELPPTLLEARQRLLEGIMATWKPPRPKRSSEPPTSPVLHVIDLDAERASVDRLRNNWISAANDKREAVEYSRLNHTSPGPDYWKAEALARARYLAATHVLDVLEEST